MKILLIILLLTSSIAVYAVDFGCIFTLIDPSATNTALGLFAGGANIWNQNPLDVWSNPAKLGYFKGISYSYSHDKCLEFFGDDKYFYSSYLTVGWKGLGIMLPLKNGQSKYGTSIDNGSQYLYDEDAQLIGIFNSWESSSGFAIGMNILEFYAAISNNDKITKLQPFTDFSLGYNYNHIISDLSPDNLGEGLKGSGSSYIDGLGMILRVSPLNDSNYLNFSFFKAEAVFSLYYRNISRTNIAYVNEVQHDPLPFSTDSAVSFRLAMSIDYFKDMISTDFYDVISTFCQDVVSLNYYMGISDFMDEFENNGYSYDLTFLDLIAIRLGYCDDEVNDVSGRTPGIGLKLSYKDIMHLQYNFAKYPDGSYQIFKYRQDFMLNVDLFKLFSKQAR
ncbi:MAG: hypothetical protein K9M99_08235 [Candidatus Cloacimonetes bacterium]|nr:hypothetical protein [Candidatus Cloacimonadota bacterium]